MPEIQSKSMGLTLRVLTFAVVLILPSLLLAFYFAHLRGEEALERIRREALTLAKVLASQKADAFARVRLDMEALARSSDPARPSLSSECPTDLHRLEDANPLYEEIVLFDRSGRLLCAGTPAIDPWLETRVLGERRFRQALETKEFFFTEGLQRPGSGRWTIAAVQPVLSHMGEVQAVLIARLNLSWLQNLMSASLLLPEHSGIGLLDSTGRILATAPRSDLIGRLTPDAELLKAHWQRSEEGFVESVGIDGIERLWAYTRLDGKQLYVRVGMSKGTVTQARNEALRMTLAAAGVVVALTLLLGWFGARVLVLRPVRLLIQAADRLGAGDWRARTGLPHAPDAIGRLARKLDELASHGQRTTRALTALSACNRTILRETEEAALLKAMCEVAVAKAGYRLVLVNFARNDEARTVETVAAAGVDEGFIRNLGITWDETPSGRGTVGTAIRTGAASIIKSIATDARVAPWRERALERDFGSIASFPLKVQGKVIGALTLIAGEEDAFDEDEIELLDELAADLSFGIEVLRSRARQAEAERQLERAATHDRLTDLPNAPTFLAALAGRIEEASRREEPVAVLLVHLPRLQDVYDSLGYDPGNAVIVEMAQRLKGLAKGATLLARTSNEEFALALPASDARAASEFGRSLLVATQSAVRAGGAEVELQAAVGASYFPGHGDDADLLLRRAGIAAREAARKGNSFGAYGGATERENPGRLEMAVELRAAIEQRRLILHYQPKLDLATNAVKSCEALVRWPHPTKGMIPPGQFVPVAEQTGLIRELTYTVIDAAIRQQRAWLADGRRVPIAVNLSVRNLYDARLLSRIEGLLSTWGVPAQMIEFEITESALMEEPETARASIARLRELGSKIYIDDFGTGYSSLAYLVSLPVHALKIDRAFVVQMTKTHHARSMVASVISMAHGLGLRVVAEGVETADEAQLLRDLHCDELQGYHVGRPVAAEGFQHAGAPNQD